MTIPTPAQLAASLADLAAGYDAEIVGLGQPDPALGRHIAAMARRIGRRVPAWDPRLAAFAPHTDPAGYVWLTDNRLPAYLAEAAAGQWSFERWLSGLADLAQTAEPPDPDELASLAADGQHVDQLRAAGFRPTEAHLGPDGGGFILKRSTAGAWPPGTLSEPNSPTGPQKRS
jgi:hypothetical protein